MMWVKLASLLMALGVGLGAFGAHALKGKIDPYLLEVFKTGVLYHMIHALGLLAVGWLSTIIPSEPKVFWAGVLMVSGILLFSGSLYIICLTGVRAFGAVTPLGGLCFLAAWIILFMKV